MSPIATYAVGGQIGAGPHSGVTGQGAATLVAALAMLVPLPMASGSGPGPLGAALVAKTTPR